MADSDSEDDLRPHALRQAVFGASLFDDTDDEHEVRDYDSDGHSLATSICSSHREYIDNDYASSPTGSDDDVSATNMSNLEADSTQIGPEIEPQLPPAERSDIGENPAPRKGRSIADHLIHKNELFVVSFDIEHGGEYCGILQLSAEVCRLRIGETPGSYTKDRLEDWMQHTSVFNSYVNPGANAIWDDAQTAVHGLRRTDPRITSAPTIQIVWQNFCEWFNTLAAEFPAAVMVAWNGVSCDLKWLWKICQAPNSPCVMPEKIQYYMDPYNVIQTYTSCKLHPSKSKLESISCGSVYQYINDGELLDDAHDALVDCKAQTTILLSEEFVPFINRTQSIQTITKIFKDKDIKQMMRDMEPTRPVHGSWKELTAEFNVEWEPSPDDKYDGSRGGPDPEPTQYLYDTARHANSLADIFFAILPVPFFEKVAGFTDKYCYQDWVVEKTQNDSDGRAKKKQMLVPCTRSTPGARHRANKHGKWSYEITTGFVIAWIALLVLQGGHFGSDKRTAKKMWRKKPHGFDIPYVRNSMTSMAYEFMRAYIHFCDNDKRPPKNSTRYDPLFKIRYALETIIKGIRKVWRAGKRITIDESMIRYMGRAVNFVQYMPAKPIKHGIKVYAVCCAVSRIMMGYDVYLGKENDDRTTLQVVDDLLHSANLQEVRGRELFTDNYYTSVSLAKHLFEKYGMTICGTMTPTSKKTRTNSDVPFLKLSNGARNSVPRGWYREAVLECKTSTGKIYYVQCTVWRDKKQVMFLHTNTIGRSQGHSVRRHLRGVRERSVINAPFCHRHYSENFNAVDINDRDSSDYSTSIRTIRYYIRILCWSLDRVIHTCYVCVCECAKNGIGDPSWKKYLSKHNGRHDFQIDLAMALLNYGIGLDWDGSATSPRPDYMRQREFVPCDCKACFFCKKGFTGGIVNSREQPYVIQCKCSKRMRTKGCTGKRVNIGASGSYCRLCYRNSTETNRNAKIRQCRTSRLGCPSCKEPICKECWPMYDHNIGL